MKLPQTVFTFAGRMPNRAERITQAVRDRNRTTMQAISDHDPARAISARLHLDLAPRWREIVREIEAGGRRAVEVWGVVETDRRVEHAVHAWRGLGLGLGG